MMIDCGHCNDRLCDRMLFIGYPKLLKILNKHYSTFWLLHIGLRERETTSRNVFNFKYHTQLKK